MALTAGAAIAADLVFPTMGASPVNELARDLPGGELDPIGRVRVDPWLRPAGRTNMFALGDVAARGDLMTIVAITRQAPWLARMIKAVVAGRPGGFLAPVCALAFAANSRSARSEGGASVLPLRKRGLTVGGFLTSVIKGKTLFIPRYRKEFGIK